MINKITTNCATYNRLTDTLGDRSSGLNNIGNDTQNDKR